MKSMIKEVVVLIAMVILAVLIMGITFYDYIPTYKTVPEVQKYIPDSKITTALEEIEDEEVESILIKPLTIDSKKLDVYQAKKSYEKGKANPFTDYSKLEEVVIEVIGNTSSGTTQSSNNGSSNSSSNKDGQNNNSSNNNSNTNNNSTSNGKSSESEGKFFNTTGKK